MPSFDTAPRRPLRCLWCRAALPTQARPTNTPRLYCSHSHRVLAYYARRYAGVPVDAEMSRRRSLGGGRPRKVTA